MACGVPSVVTDVGDSAWIVGETGVVVPPKNPVALATGWKVSLARDRSEMALKARLRVEENFSVGQMTEQTEKVIWPKA
jgi:glycosyltransferase involved in cell wall biosynthesis